MIHDHDREPPDEARRSVLRAVVALGGLALLPAPIQARPEPLARVLLEIASALRGRPGIRELGIAWLHGLSTPDPAAFLQGSLVVRLRGPDSTDDRTALAERLRAAVARDFERGDVAVVEGWCLSTTELQLAALAALVPRSS